MSLIFEDADPQAIGGLRAGRQPVKEAAMQQGTALPPAPPKKRRIWPWIVGTILVVLVVQAAAQTTTDPEPVAPTIEEPTIEEPAVTDEATQLEIARLVWDVQTPTDQATICGYYNTPPVGTTPELIQAFAEGADMSYADAERILDQLLAEEC